MCVFKCHVYVIILAFGSYDPNRALCVCICLLLYCTTSCLQDLMNLWAVKMGLIARKPVLGGSDKASFRPSDQSLQLQRLARKLKHHL